MQPHMNLDCQRHAQKFSQQIYEIFGQEYYSFEDATEWHQ